MRSTDRHAWDYASAGWDRHRPLIRTWLESATNRMLDAANLSVGSKVLDVAAGTGDQTLEIAHRVGPTGYVLATDISAPAIELAQANAELAGLTQIQTRVLDAQELGLSGAQFDAVVCRLGLMFCLEPLAALKQIYSSLKKYGCFSGLVFSRPQRNPCVEISLTIALKHAGSAKTVEAQIDELVRPGALLSLGQIDLVRQLMVDAGFSYVNVDPIEAPLRVPSVHDYVSFLRSSASPIIQILAPLCAREQKAAWDEITEQLNMFTVSRDSWVGPNELLLLRATTGKLGH